MKTNKSHPRQMSLLRTLVYLTILFIAAQLSLFLIHHEISGLLNSLVNSSMAIDMFHIIILLPLIRYIMLQLCIYALFVGWIWFISVSIGEVFKLTSIETYWLGIFCWLLACLEILFLNAYYFPGSFFAKLINQINLYPKLNIYIILIISALLLAATLIAYFNLLFFKRYRTIGCFLLLVGLSAGPLPLSSQIFFSSVSASQINFKPNIILIGIDSLRPDFVNYFGNPTIHTPHIDKFLQTATIFTDAYTPLARTFPAWVSILTAKYPKHNGARNNLMDPKPIVVNDTLAKRLQQEGYETIYATDENRFSNITKDYGFDRIIGPNMGANDFLLAGLGDFPLSNLLINLPIGRFLFPYNYANRAAAITYKPDTFMHLIHDQLANRSHKPLFLVVHLCLTHWPFTWAHNQNDDNFNLVDRYRNSIEAVDQQLGELLQMLKENGLLENSFVVLLSDHGTTLGTRGDRLISKKNFLGDKKDINIINRTRLSSAPEFSIDFKRDYSLSASYGHGTDILGLKQNHVLLAFNGYNIPIPHKQINERCLLIDLTPTVLDMLHLPHMQHADGISLWNYFSRNQYKSQQRPLYLETADKFAGIETDKINIPKVVKERIAAYHIDLENGLLYLDIPKETLIHNKQHAILLGDWLLVSYPIPKKFLTTSSKQSSYFILINLKKGQWTIGLSSALAKTAPINELLHDLKAFYGDEI